jgi:hypothetical protein
LKTIQPSNHLNNPSNLNNLESYELTDSQTQVYNTIKKLDEKKLYYFSINQKKHQVHLTLPEIRKHTERTFLNYTRDLNPFLRRIPLELINDNFKYIGIIETGGYFHKSQLSNNKLYNDKVDLDLHLHLFVQPINSCISMENFSYNLFTNLNSQKNKSDIIRDFDYQKFDPSNKKHRFFYYHTKQFQTTPYNYEMILTNIN